MELDKLGKLEEEPPLPGAYIRSLVKQLSTSKPKDFMNTKDQNCVVNGDFSRGENLAKHGKVADARQAQPQQHKKQVRRRLHTSRPYQERLLNMAEARREIVTALKYHRAAMKEQQQQQPQEQHQRPSVSLQPSFEQDGRFKSRRNPRIYPSCTTSSSSYMNDFSYSCSSQQNPPLVPKSYTWPASSSSPIPPPSLMAEIPDFVLPNQPLGLNLNFHDFHNLDATLHLNNSSSSSYSSAPSSSPPQEVHPGGISQGEGFSSMVDNTVESNAATRVGGGLHTAMDDEGMAEIRSLGEQYQMEWNDTMNLVKSACWFKFLKNMEHRAPEDDAYNNFDQRLEFPAWLNANESCLEQCSEDYFLDSTLPCMDIGDIDSVDDDWLA